MNAKKIMGAVLVALLAAALFVGAGAAAVDASVDGNTVFFYQTLDSKYEGTWNNGANSFTIAPGANFVSNTALPEGKYSYNDSVSIYLKKPTAAATGEAGATGATYQVIGNTLYQNDKATFTLVSAATDSTVEIAKVLLVYPNGVEEQVSGVTQGNSVTFTFASLDAATGQYKIKAVFAGPFATTTPVTATISDVIGTFTVAEADKVEASASAESFIQGDAFTVTITGKPGMQVNLTAENLEIKSLGALDPITQNTWDVKIPNIGSVTIYVVAGSETGAGKIIVKEYSATQTSKTLKTLSVKVTAGTITATTDKDSYYIGDDVKLSGTSTVGGPLYAYIAGTNAKITSISGAITVSNNAWKLELDGEDIRDMKLDAGTYTVYISTNGNAATIKDIGTYTTVSLVLKQPFISITDAPAVAVQDTKYKVTGTAEATDDVKYYIFGTNLFKQGNVTVEKGAFEMELKIENMDPGQYFMVVQHKMYDGVYNLQIENDVAETYPVYLFDSDGQQTSTKPLFTVKDRQKTNAAQAFVDELAGQNIDDMYVKLSFVVAAPESVINPIPAEVTKGSKLTVSGTTNMGPGEIVTVEMLSTAFAAQPKETVGSASFILLTTKTDENGNWEVTFDTTGLNVDEYTVTAAVADLNKATAKVNVIEGAPTEQPTTQPTQTEQPTQPTETTTPETPGFGALAALAGLGAVAVLLLRRE